MERRAQIPKPPPDRPPEPVRKPNGEPPEEPEKGPPVPPERPLCALAFGHVAAAVKVAKGLDD